MTSETTRRTIQRRLPTPDVLGYDEPLPQRLWLMAEDALSGKHREQVEEEIRTALAILDPWIAQARASGVDKK